MTNDPGHSAAIHALTEGDPPPVWSLLVTVFGDLAQTQDTRFSGALLREITAPLGIRPEALRVALHRLRKEGWITSHRSGRQSDHAVTAWGQAEIAKAAPQIYARGQRADRAVLRVSAPGEPDPPGVVLRAGLSLGPTPLPDLFCTLPADPAPAWIQDRCCPSSTQSLSRALLSRLHRVEAALPPSRPLDALHCAILRVLIVHGWRRVALRLPPVPDSYFPPAAQIPACRAHAMALLDRFPVPDLDDLARAAA